MIEPMFTKVDVINEVMKLRMTCKQPTVIIMSIATHFELQYLSSPIEYQMGFNGEPDNIPILDDETLPNGTFKLK